MVRVLILKLKIKKISDQIQSETDKLLAKVLDDASNLMTNRFSMSD